MGKKRLIVGILIFIIVTFCSTIIWMKNHNIIDDEFSKITIINNNEVVEITDRERIKTIINKINNSPRDITLPIFSGFRYDSVGEFGKLTFENENEVKEFVYILENGNIITKYFLIKTSFNF